jgi:hypothetical protein
MTTRETVIKLIIRWQNFAKDYQENGHKREAKIINEIVNDLKTATNYVKKTPPKK